MASAWDKYVESSLSKERSIILDAGELAVVEQVKERLRKANALEAWTSINHEAKLNLVRGYWERSHRVRDIADTCKDIYEWRRKNNIDRILDKRLPLHDVYHKAWPSHVAGEDKWGHWFVLDRVSEFEVSALTKYDEETVLLYRAQVLEALVRLKLEISQRLGHRVCQYVYCLDLSGLSMKKHFTAKVRSILQPLFKVSGDYYPDSLWNLFLVNAPMSFRLIWRVVSPWVDPVVKHKIRILSGKSTYLPAMVKTGIPMEAIPEAIGGKCKTITMKQVVEELIDTPEIKDHGFTQYPAPTDPAAAEAHAKQLAKLEASSGRGSGSGSGKRQSLTKRLSTAMGRGRGLRLKHKSSDGEAEGLAEDGEMIYNGEDVLMQGFLSKQGNFNTSWKKRYFVLTVNGLFYFAGKPTKESHLPRGKIELHMISNVASPNDGSDGLIEIATPQRVYRIRVDAAEGEDSVDDLVIRWGKAISTAVENDICAVEVEAVSNRRGTSHLHKGFLEKRGAFNPKFRRRYFVLTPYALYYYNDLPTNVGAALKGKIDLFDVLGCDADAKTDTDFSIAVPGRSYTFRASSAEEAADWVRRVSAAAASESDLKAEADEKEAAQEDAEAMEDARSRALSGVADPPMIRSVPEDEDEETTELLSRSNSTIIDQLTSLAQDFFDVASDMGILVKPEDGLDFQDSESVAVQLRKRVLHMFKLF